MIAHPSHTPLDRVTPTLCEVCGAGGDYLALECGGKPAKAYEMLNELQRCKDDPLHFAEKHLGLKMPEWQQRYLRALMAPPERLKLRQGTGASIHHGVVMSYHRMFDVARKHQQLLEAYRELQPWEKEWVDKLLHIDQDRPLTYTVAQAMDPKDA